MRLSSEKQRASRTLRVRPIGTVPTSNVEGQKFETHIVKAMTYKIDTYHYPNDTQFLLAKNWLVQYQDNVTEWDIGQWYQPSDLLIGQHYK